MIVVADTGPIRNLVLIDKVQVLASLYQQVHVPAEVLEELRHPHAPDAVRGFANRLPSWIVVSDTTPPVPSTIVDLDRGERAALALAAVSPTSIVLTDDSDARLAAFELQIKTVGTLGILRDAAIAGLIDFDRVLQSLLDTSIDLTDVVIERVRNDIRRLRPANDE